MKKIVIYYSLDGNTRFVARALADKMDADVFELKTKTGKKMIGFSKYIIGGFQAVFGAKPALSGTPAKMEKYDLIVLGGPVWASRPAPVINSFLASSKLKGKRIALFCCSGDSKVEGYFVRVRARLKGNSIIGTASFQEPLAADRKEMKEKITDWAKKIGKK